MSCTCQNCGQHYKVDLLIPDQLWDRIRPEGKEAGAGLLCGPCIMRRVEEIDDYGVLDARISVNDDRRDGVAISGEEISNDLSRARWKREEADRLELEAAKLRRQAAEIERLVEAARMAR